jgi:hypothetical protein
MSDEVGVRPGRLNELASKLEHLRDVLAANVPVIVNTLNVYWSGGTGTPVNLAPLQHGGARSVQDAAEIRARYNLALAWEERANARLHRGMISIPWVMSGPQFDAASAKADADLLAKAKKSGDQAVIRSVERDIADHKADQQWLAEFWKLEHQADYQAGAQLAKTLKQTIGNDGNYQHALSVLAQEAGNPYFVAGLLNNLNSEQFVYLMILSQQNPGLLPPTKTDQAIVTAMAAGTLRPKMMQELVTWLTSPNANASGNQFLTDPLLQEIAKNRDASAHLISFIDPKPQASGSPVLEKFLKLYGSFGAENSVLKIMANAVAAAPSQQEAEAMITSMVQDLRVLDSGTISQSGDGLAAFMNAASLQLMPPADPNSSGFPENWYPLYAKNINHYLDPLLSSIGTAFQGHADSVRFWRGYFEGVVSGALLAAIPLDGVPEAGVIAAGAAEPAILPFTMTQKELDFVAAHLFPDSEDAAQAEVSDFQALKFMVITAGVIRVYRAAGDTTGAAALLNSPEFYNFVMDYAKNGEQADLDYPQLSQQFLSLPGRPGQPEELGTIMAHLYALKLPEMP